MGSFDKITKIWITILCLCQNCTFYKIFQLNVDRFSWDFYDRDSLAVWASFWWMAVSVSDTCPVWWGSMDVLVVSSHPMALFISLCSQSTLLEVVPMSVPVGVLDGGAVGTLATSGVSNARIWEGEWLLGTVPSSMSAHGDACWEVAISLDVAKIIQEKNSWSSVAILLQLGVALGHCVVESVEKGGVEALKRPRMMGTWSSSLTQERSTCSSKGLWTGMPRVLISQMGHFWSQSSTGSKPPFRPSGHTTCSSHCRSLHTSIWWRSPQVILLSAPSIMVLMWPSLARGTCRVPLLSHTKVYAQLSPKSMSRVSFLATSSKEERSA